MKPLKLVFAALLAAVSTHAATVGGLADVSLYDLSDGRQLPVYWHEGRAYVVGKPGNEYAERIRNRQREDVLGVISVDGVNVITGETAVGAAKRLRPRSIPRTRYQRLAQEPRLDRSVLLHVAAGFLRCAHRPSGQCRCDRRGALPQEGGARTGGAAGAVRLGPARAKGSIESRWSGQRSPERAARRVA